ncbi:hypothetical protein AXF42_Ash003573 [Apostasia shenzhenica]|uniref:Uncharacterized protein n=1 Tax=Apostasia shenzhenica TaxID=1088818 RepID=A0A2I0BGK9_9ASPA|nr:hypothetical protein AXF42_Ash003573 [Apostasia shenzhenica]
MATAAASKAVALFRRGFGELKTSAARSLSAAAEADPTKPKRRKKKNLFDVALFLPNWGIGYKMAKNHWRDVYYKITKINLYKDGRHGKAWGIRYKAGLPSSDASVKISGVNKPGWRYLRDTNKKKPEDSLKAEQPISM